MNGESYGLSKNRRFTDGAIVGAAAGLQGRNREDEPDEQNKSKLATAIEKGQILFFGAFDGEALAGCCSVTVGFSTFDYAPSGVFEDFYICPEYRHKGVARELVRFAWRESGVSSLTVGCADCDVEMYQSLGFGIPLGNLLAIG